MPETKISDFQMNPELLERWPRRPNAIRIDAICEEELTKPTRQLCRRELHEWV